MTYLAPVPADVPTESVIYPRVVIAHEHDVETICFAPTTTAVAPANKDLVAVDQPSGKLQVNGQTLPEAANVQRMQLSTSQVPRWDLTFVCEQQCDANRQ